MPTIDHANEFAIGIDIGGTKTLVALVSNSGGVMRATRFATQPENGQDSVLDRIGRAVTELQDEAAALGGAVLGIGIASAGVLDTGRQRIIYAANLGWRDVPIGERLSRHAGLPVKLGNDASLAAVAEYIWGSRRTVVRDLIYVTVSTGIGAGIVSGGRLVEGSQGSAGEFGHITADPYGSACGCGNYGCLENYSSGTAIATLANERLGPQGDGSRWTARDVTEAADAGHAGALEIMKLAAFHLGNGLTSLIHLFNPQRIVLGGGVMASGLLLRETIRVTGERAIPGMRKHVEIERTRLGEQLGVLGAAGLFYMNEQPESSK